MAEMERRAAQALREGDLLDYCCSSACCRGCSNLCLHGTEIGAPCLQAVPPAGSSWRIEVLPLQIAQHSVQLAVADRALVGQRGGNILQEAIAAIGRERARGLHHCGHL